jgi:putative addiction module component (TIGR02574 family)
MAARVQKLKKELEALPAADRAMLVRFLIKSLEQEQESNAVAAFEEELGRRVAEIKAGKARGIPAEEVFARLREKYA